MCTFLLLKESVLQVILIRPGFLAGGVGLEQIGQQRSARQCSQNRQRTRSRLKQKRQSGQQSQHQMRPEYKLDGSLLLLPSGSGYTVSQNDSLCSLRSAVS